MTSELSYREFRNSKRHKEEWCLDKALAFLKISAVVNYDLPQAESLDATTDHPDFFKVQIVEVAPNKEDIIARKNGDGCIYITGRYEPTKLLSAIRDKTNMHYADAHEITLLVYENSDKGVGIEDLIDWDDLAGRPEIMHSGFKRVIVLTDGCARFIK